MRSSAYVLVSLFAFSLIASACSSNDNNQEDADPFDTLAACYEEHHDHESLSVQKAIVVCCIDHPIAGEHPSCKDTQADCVAHLNTELSTESLTATDIQDACTTYLQQKDM